MGPSWRQRIINLARTVASSARSSDRSPSSRPPAPSSAPQNPPQDTYPGDFAGVPEIDYAPADDGDPDPGEVVWAWVPYEEDHSQGKDRPVLVIGRDGRYLLALGFTSKDHDRDLEEEARADRFWFDVGSGAWDSSGRPSEVRLDRVLRLEAGAVRREGATLDRRRFEALATELRRTANDR